MIFFTADEHFGHDAIRKYCNRPFASVEEMDGALVANFNSCVGVGDTIYHLGDFCFKNKTSSVGYRSRLNGNNIFLKGNHDKETNDLPHIMEITIEGQFIVLAHYSMRVWNRCHYGSWQLYGHSHGTLPPIGKQFDVGVDNNNYFPISFTQLKEKLDLVPNHVVFDKR